METKKYEVKWTEAHLAEVEAENTTEAFAAAADYAGGHNTCVDEDGYECQLADGSDAVERSAAVIRDALNMRRVVTINIDGGTVIIEDRLVHPIESCSRVHKTVMEEAMLDDLIGQLGYMRVAAAV